MRLTSTVVSLLLVAALPVSAAAQHAQVTCVAVNPNDASEVWTCNRDNDSVSVVDVASGTTVAEIPVGVRPRSLAFSADGARVFVANQRGNVPVDRNFVSPFTGTEIRGTVTVIDVGSRSALQTLTLVGTEPYGVAVAPNGKYFAVSGFRSGTIKLFNAQTLAPLVEQDYLADLNFIPPPFTVADADSNRDGIADLGEPRGFVIRSDSTRIYVTHLRSPFVSVLDVTLDGNGLPTGIALAAKINTNVYPFDPFFNPVPVQVLQSQGVPRFLEDIALSPDGTRALVPHVLHNVNHDVNFNFGPALPGAFANRVYPALTMIDAAANTFDQPGDASNRLHNELSDPRFPAEYSPFGDPTPTAVGLAILGGQGSPLVGGSMTFVIDGLAPGQTAVVRIGNPTSIPMGSVGTQLCTVRNSYPVPPSGVVSIPIRNVPSLIGSVVWAQALFFSSGGQPQQFSNALRVRFGTQGFGLDKLGLRAAQPSRVAFNPAGDCALMLNRGSEDLFLYRVNGSSMELASVFPPRLDFAERTPLDTATPLGDLPLGMTLVPDASTSNDDALLYVMNELTRTLSVLRVDYKTGTIHKVHAQIPTHLGPDAFSTSVRLGDELFEDASRAQTTGAWGTVGGFNNSCGSCHFEGGEDGNVWQRPNGPRSTMPVYQGSLLTGLILWKGSRLNMGETGPMFGGENGGNGVLTDAEQQALVDHHPTMPVPLNPHLDPVTGQYSPLAAFGKDLYFGTNDTGLNPTLRSAGCASCHPDHDASSGGARGYTADFIDPQLTSGENLAAVDPSCFSLQGNIVALNLRNVNSGVNVDFNNNGIADLDRNSDGYRDVETYTPMNTDKSSNFTRDDLNSYLCPSNPNDPNSPPKNFQRDMRVFSIPTKLGVFSSGPYFHDHSAFSLRNVVDPESQATSAVYGSPAFPASTPYPGLKKFFNEFHDMRGHEQFSPGASKVQINLQSTNVQADIEAVLAYIESL